jgi:hypothetical protein
LTSFYSIIIMLDSDRGSEPRSPECSFQSIRSAYSSNQSVQTATSGPTIFRYSTRDFAMDGSVSIDKLNAEYLLRNPICCGYLLKFCKTEHNDENIQFVLAVDSFRDSLSIDNKLWGKPMKELDSMYISPSTAEDTGAADPEWPSTNIMRESVEQDIIKMRETFIADDAPKQICLPSLILDKTTVRMRHFAAYGPRVFDEAVLDPVKTMSRDILPRFLNSPICAKMLRMLGGAFPLPSGADLVVDPPDNQKLFAEDVGRLTRERRYTLEDVFAFRSLYNRFLRFLQDKVSSENLLCVRLIHQFRETLEFRDVEGAEKIAWKIFLFFVAANSAFEVSLSYVEQKKLMRKLCEPSLEMFDPLEKSAKSVLHQYFEEFKKTESYSSIAIILRDERSQRGASTSRFGCIGFCDET